MRRTFTQIFIHPPVLSFGGFLGMGKNYSRFRGAVYLLMRAARSFLDVDRSDASRASTRSYRPIGKVLSRDLCKRVSSVGRSACLGRSRSRAQVRYAAPRGYTRGRQPSCGGSRQHRCVPALFAGAQRASGVGGTRPAPACPRRGKRERGRSNSLLPQAISAASIGSGGMARNRPGRAVLIYRFRAA
jgi:hypothetical protein